MPFNFFYQLIATGTFYITSCEVNNQRYLRVVLIHPDTQLHHLESLLDHIRSIAEKVVV